MGRHVWCVLLSVIILTSTLQGQTTGFFALQDRLVELFADTRDSVVRVKAAYEADKPGEKPEVIVGTGFFISREGLVLTAASIVLRPQRVWVEHRDVAYAAEVVGIDAVTNLALLRVVETPPSFNFLPLRDTPELPAVGTLTVCLSNPLEFPVSPRLGMISGLESRIGQRFFPCTYIRTTVQAVPGDAGAAYLDLNGRLIGIQVLSIQEIASTYIIPARAALRIRDDLLFSGSVTYGWFGFEINEEQVEGGRRLVISVIEPDTPAAQAGLLPGDEILQVGPYQIGSVEDLRNAIFYARVDEYVQTVVRREGDEMEFNVRITARPVDDGAPAFVPEG